VVEVDAVLAVAPVSLLTEGGLRPTLWPAKRPDTMRRRSRAVPSNVVRAAVMLRRSAQPSEVMTCEVSFNLVRHARIDKIQ
jgi:hypothetical protein